MLVMKSRILGRERSRKESVETLYSVIHLSVLVIHTRVFTPPSGLLGQISAYGHRPLLLFNAWSKFLGAVGETLRLCYDPACPSRATKIGRLLFHNVRIANCDRGCTVDVPARVSPAVFLWRRQCSRDAEAEGGRPLKRARAAVFVAAEGRSLCCSLRQIFAAPQNCDPGAPLPTPTCVAAGSCSWQPAWCDPRRSLGGRAIVSVQPGFRGIGNPLHQDGGMFSGWDTVLARRHGCFHGSSSVLRFFGLRIHVICVRSLILAGSSLASFFSLVFLHTTHLAAPHASSTFYNPASVACQSTEAQAIGPPRPPSPPTRTFSVTCHCELHRAKRGR